MNAPDTTRDTHPGMSPDAHAPEPATAQPPAPAWSALFTGANALRTLILAGGVVLHAVNVYVAATILPSVVHDIGGLEYYAWNTTLFVTASIVGAALSSRALALYGGRGTYGAGAAIFAVGAVTCALAGSMPVMLAGRTVQGFGGGLLLALSYAMIRIVYDPSLWSRAVGLVSAMWGVATLIGPAVGGMFAQARFWRGAFWSLVPVAAGFALLAMAVLPRRAAARPTTSTLALGQVGLMAAAVLALSAGGISHDARSAAVGLAAFVALMVPWVWLERRGRQPLLPAGALQPRSQLCALYLSMGLLAVSVTTSEIFVPLFLQVLHRQSPLTAGYLAASMSAGWSVGSILSAGRHGRAVPRAMMAAPVLGLIGMGMLWALLPVPASGGWRDVAPICAALVMVGLGVGLAWPHLLTRVLRIAPAGQRDLASTSLTTVQLFCTALAAALAGLVANAAGLDAPGGVAGTASAAWWLFAVFSLCPLACVASVARVLYLSR